MASVLLVEFAASDGPQRGILLPYAKGHLLGSGHKVQWLRFAVSAETPSSGGIDLKALDRERLLAALDDCDADRVVFSPAPAASLTAALFDAHPGLRIGVAVMERGYAIDADQGVSILGDEVAAWARFLDPDATSDPDGTIFDRALPDFRYTPAGPAVAALQPLPYIILGSVCAYQRSVRSNPMYAGVDLADCSFDAGCAFCDIVRSPAGSTGGVDGFPAQLRALMERPPPGDARLEVRIVGSVAAEAADTIAAWILDAGAPPADWSFDARPDQILRAAESLEAAATLFAGTGHRIHVSLIGVENFAAAELERMNKGLMPEVALAALETLLDLERRASGTFGFREHGGVSLILFTPWITLDDLRFNLTLLKDLGILALSGKALTSRLRLLPGHPIAALAAKDGLVTDHFEDPAWATSWAGLYPDDLPWRFQDARVSEVYSALLRDEGGTRERLERALALADRLARPDVPAAGRPGRFEEEELQGLQAQVAAGIKPVAKYEFLDEEQVERLVSGGNLPNPIPRAEAGHGTWSLFFGEDPRSVHRAVELTRLMEDASFSQPWRDATLELGGLLGYPRCCVEAYMNEPWVLRQADSWINLRRRLDAGEQVHPALNPAGILAMGRHVPCSLDCEASLALQARRLDAFTEQLGGDVADRVSEAAANPWLIFVDPDNQAVELIPEQPPGARFRVRPGARIGRDATLDGYLADLDEVWMDGPRLLLRTGRGATHDFSGRAFVWWWKQVFQADLWGPAWRIRAAAAAPQQDEAPATPRREESPEVIRLRLHLERTLERARLRGAAREEFSVSVTPRPASGGFSVRLSDGTATAGLMVRANVDGEEAWFRHGPFSFAHDGNVAPDHSEIHPLLVELLRRLILGGD